MKLNWQVGGSGSLIWFGYGKLYVYIMNALGLSLIVKMGCLCTKDVVTINSQKFYVLEQLGEG